MREPRPWTAAAQLSRDVGLLAGRLANFLAPDGSDGRFTHAHEFLMGAFSEAAAPEATGPPLQAPGPDNPLDRLVRAYRLTLEDVDLVLLAGMPEEHEGYAAVMRSLHPRGEPRVSGGLAAQVLHSPGEPRSSFRARLESGPLLRNGLIRLRGDAPFYEMSLELAESLWPVLQGIDVWPAKLMLCGGEAVRAGLDEWFADSNVACALEALALRPPCTILVTAETGEIALHRGMALVAESGARPAGLQIPPDASAEFEHLVAIHTLARGVVPVLRAAPVEGPAMPPAPGFHGCPGPVVICGRRGAMAATGERPIMVAPVERLGSGAHRRMWSAIAPELNGETAALAARYPIEPAYAAEAVRDVRAACPGTVSAKRIGMAIQARSSLSLAGGVQLVKASARRDHLVLHPDRLRQLQEALDRLVHQQRVLDDWGFLCGRPGARGVRMLFAGPPGTGKTLSAEVMARELSMDLLIVDISRVVSKWVGETEKNLSAVFDTAERARAVLFFDEADALFGKRTEVSDAHDRYANLETAYLLARLERFEGLAILATNLRQNIDPAFVRRLEFAISFDEPGREERMALWSVHLPTNAPIGPDVNLRELANLFPVVGALIRNASVAAGFLAAADGGVILRSHLIHGLRREYEKAGKAFPGIPDGVAGPGTIPGKVRRDETKEEVCQ